MNPDLIRSLPQPKSTCKKSRPSSQFAEKQIALPTVIRHWNSFERIQFCFLQPQPLSLLTIDRSTLTTDEWILLSNFLHAFDEQNIRQKIEYHLNQISVLPPKLRLRTTDTYSIIGQFFSGIQPLIERTPDLYSLPKDARRVLTKYNLDSAGAFNGIFLCQEFDLYRNPYFSNSCDIHYGHEHMLESIRNSSQCDPNGNLNRIMLFVMAFSSNCSAVYYHSEQPVSSVQSSVSLIRIQNVYITMLWKYFLYLYGFKEAVIRYSYIIKNFLNVTQMLASMQKNDTHDLMIETIKTEAERALIIRN